jgi:hypothetical protein
MARSRITSSTKDLLSDDGAVLFSIVNGEQLQYKVTLNWITSMAGFAKQCKIVEALNLGDGGIPEMPRPNGVVTSLSFIDTNPNDNIFHIVFPETLISGWTVKPTPTKSVYGYIDLEIVDTGSGINKQVWKPLRGLIEILYSPTEQQ